MGEYEIQGVPAPIIIGATGLAGLMQALRIIMSTIMYSVPMDRAFASTGSFVDAPLPHAAAARIAELTEAIERYEPRVTVTHIRFTPGQGTMADLGDGRVFPVLRFRLRPGVTL